MKDVWVYCTFSEKKVKKLSLGLYLFKRYTFVHLGANILGANKYILCVIMYILGANKYMLSVNVYISGANISILGPNVHFRC